MRLVLIDKYIPFIKETIEAASTPWDEVQVKVLEPEQFTRDSVRNADALIVRTRTRIDQSLLEGSRVGMVATATIGYDHIDTDYCRQSGIQWVSCPGCNAQAVCDYVQEALNELGYPMIAGEMPTLGVVGVGHVGSLVAKMAEEQGWRVLLNDAPKQIGVSLDEIAEKCDVITFHTPLTLDGEYPTYHLCNADFLSQCRPNVVIINAARGGVVDENALVRSGYRCVIDTWEGEPILNAELVRQAYRASFHIAGYSVLGKYNASQRCLRAIADYFCLPILQIDKKVVSLQQQKGDSEPGWLSRVSDELKVHLSEFEQLRKQYKLR